MITRIHQHNKLIKGRICWLDKTWQGVITFAVFSCFCLLLIFFRDLPDYFSQANSKNEETLLYDFLFFGGTMITSFLFYFLSKNGYWLLEFTPKSLKISNKFDGRIKMEIQNSDIISISLKGNLHFLHIFRNSIEIKYNKSNYRQTCSINLYGYGLPEWEKVLREFELHNIHYTSEKSFFQHIVKSFDDDGLLHLEYKFDLNNE